MNRKALLIAVVLALVAAAAWWWPTDRRRIIAASKELADAVSVPASEPDLARVTRAARLSRLLASDFQMIVTLDVIVINGRDSAIAAATRLRPPRGLQVSAGELDLQIDGTKARARTVVTTREPAAGGSAESTQSWEVEMHWTRGDAWVLSTAFVSGEEKTNYD